MFSYQCILSIKKIFFLRSHLDFHPLFLQWIWLIRRCNSGWPQRLHCCWQAHARWMAWTRVLNDTCGAEEISQVACMIKKLDKKLDSIIELVQGKLSSRHGKIPETVLDLFSPMWRSISFELKRFVPAPKSQFIAPAGILLRGRNPEEATPI